MMKVAFAGSFAGRVAELVWAELATPCELITDDETGIVQRLGDVEVLVSMSFSAAMADAAPRLRLLQVPGAGLDRIDQGAVRPETFIANVYGHEAAIAEYVMGAMITLTRSFGRLDAEMRRGRWESQWAVGSAAPPPWPELAGKTLGILGFGAIGQALARRAAAFDMRVCAVRRRVEQVVPDHVAFMGGPEQIDTVLHEADYLAITLALSPETRGLLDARRLALLTPTAYLVNVARAAIVDELALFEALAGGRLAGAALDVWYRYPSTAEPTLPSHQPFHQLSNVLMTPHISGWTGGMLEARARLIAENIGRIGRGEIPRNAVKVPG